MMDAIEKPTNQEFIDWFRNIWSERIINGNLNSDPLDILSETVTDILWGFEEFGDVKDWLEYGSLTHHSRRGYPVTKTLVKTAIYLWYNWSE